MAIVYVVVGLLVAAVVVGLALDEPGPCESGPRQEGGDHRWTNGTWARKSMNEVGQRVDHACIDADGYATKSWTEWKNVRLAPEPMGQSAGASP